MPESDLDLLVNAAHEAGEIALHYFKSNPKVWDKGDGAGPVTEADLEVNRMLHRTLREARPDYGWLSEESEDDSERLTQEHVFIVDPIDGTRAFIEGHKHWAHSLAIAHKGEVSAAVVFLPSTAQLYSALRGHGAHRNGRPLSVSPQTSVDGARVLASKANFSHSFWPRGVPGMERHFRSSLAYRLALVAEGSFDAMFTLRPTWEWDIAAGQLLVQEAGGRVCVPSGAPISLNGAAAKVAGLVAGPDAVTSGITAALADAA